MKRAVHLLIIDPQNDFCDLPDDHLPPSPAGAPRATPSLPVTGAHADLQRTASLLRRAGHAIDAVTVTLDTHQRLDIAHPGFWRRADTGGDPAPFTSITAADVRAGRFAPHAAEATAQVLDYLDALEARGRYTLMVWPVHCTLGSWGHAVHADLHHAIDAWQDAHRRNASFVNKGRNPWTEHYSALLAEVPMADDPSTQLNHALLHRLDTSDVLLVAGQASSHCVKATVEDLVEQLPNARPERLVLLTDCMSPVAGFESAATQFLQSMRSLGVRLASSAEVLAELSPD